MRAVKSVSSRSCAKENRQLSKILHVSENRIPGWGAMFGLLFLIGYTAGILICREQAPAVGQALARYYMDKQNYLSLSAAFGRMYSGLFLQAGIVLLCGLSAFGSILLMTFFAVRGAVLGICAASVFLEFEARGLVVYWLLSCFTNVAALILLLYLAQSAARMAQNSLYMIWNPTVLHGALKDRFKALLIRFLLVLAIGAFCAVLGALSARLFAGILL